MTWAADIQKLIAEAVAAEREECAKVVEAAYQIVNHGPPVVVRCYTHQTIAKLIRARGNPPEDAA